MSPKSNVAAVAAALSLASGVPALANDAADVIAAFYATADRTSAPTDDLSMFFADNFVDHDRPVAAPDGVPDRAIALNLFSELKTGFPDGNHRLDMLHPIGADMAMVYWTFEGTNSGIFFGTPASGNKVSINGVDVFRVADGQFVEQWHVEELMSLFQQIAP
jgi:predicted ester cyclase